jgi:CHAD domain-containing protein
MPFHFKKAEPPDQAVRRVCREHIGEAETRLRKTRHPAAVHGARKEIKKLRAIIRLVRGEIGRVAWRKTQKALRRAAGQLAASRDARVMFKAFEQLAGRGAARRFPILHQALQKNCRRETRQFQAADAVAVAERALRKTGKRVAGLKFAATGWTAIEPGLRQSYRRGRQAGALARRQPSPEHFHAWRKEVKTFWHQLRLLCPAWPASARALTDKLNRLGELLGDDHDLALLKQFVAEHSQTGETAALKPLIESRQKKLRAAALKLGSQLFKEAPAIVCQRLGKDWNDWHGQDRKKQ